MRLAACVLVPVVLQAQLRFDVKTFGANGNGIALETNQIQKAIDEAFSRGGGIVEIPAGTYKVGTLVLKDNVDLYVGPGAELIGSPNTADYTEIEQKYESRTNGLYARYFVVFAEGAHNISITGPGTINGNGLKNFQTGNPQNMRPFLIRFVNCDHVTLRDVHLLEAANWTLHLLGCRDVNIDGVVIENGVNANRDGLDIDCCQRVTVSNSRFSTGDDAIVMKATSDALCEDIVITNCVIRTRASAIKTGTESNGGFRNITVSNCTISDIPVHAGIELMTVDGGMMQNILVENITMVRVATPFFIRLGIRARPYKPGHYTNKVDEAKDITLSNISVIDAKYPSSIMGLHSNRIKNVTVRGYTVRYAETQEAVQFNEVPFEEFSYPMARMFKKLPAYGLYCRNVEGLRLSDITMYSTDDEKRPPIAIDRVNDANLLSVKAQVNNPNAPFAHLRNIENIAAAFCQSYGTNKILFEAEDKTSSGLRLTNNVVREGQQELVRVEALPDRQIFEDFETNTKYSVPGGRNSDGLHAHDLSTPLNANLEIRNQGPLQLCLLIRNDSPNPEKVRVTYGTMAQEFLVSWNTWGWAPISLLREYDHDTTESFHIMAANDCTRLQIAKVYIRYQNIKKTD